MNCISMEIAMRYLMGNTHIFSKIRNSFLDSYKNFEKDYLILVKNKESKNLECYIHSLKGISLNLGAYKIYDESNKVLDLLRKGVWDEDEIFMFLFTLKNTYLELEGLEDK